MDNPSKFFLRYINFPFGNIYNSTVSQGVEVTGDYKAVYRACGRVAHSYHATLAAHMGAVDYLWMKEHILGCLDIAVNPQKVPSTPPMGDCTQDQMIPSNMCQLVNPLLRDYDTWWNVYGKHAIIIELVDVESKESAGCAICSYDPNMANDSISIDTLYIKPRFRNRHGVSVLLNYIGSQLKAVLALYRVIPNHSTLKYITVHASEKNGHVIEMYKRAGFREVGRGYLCFMNVDVDDASVWKGPEAQRTVDKNHQKAIAKHRKRFTVKDKVKYFFTHQTDTRLSGLAKRHGQTYLHNKNLLPTDLQREFFGVDNALVTMLTLNYQKPGKESVPIFKLGLRRSPIYAGHVILTGCHDIAILHTPSDMPGIYNLLHQYIDKHIGANLLAANVFDGDDYYRILLEKLGFRPHQLRLCKTI